MKKNIVLLCVVFAVGVYAESEAQTQKNSTNQQQSAQQKSGRILSEPQVKTVSGSSDTSWRKAQENKTTASSEQEKSDSDKSYGPEKKDEMKGKK